MEFVELVLGLVPQGRELGQFLLQASDAGLDVLQGLRDGGLLPLPLIQLPDGGRVLDLLGGIFQGSPCQVFQLLGLVQFLGEGGLVGPGFLQVLG